MQLEETNKILLCIPSRIVYEEPKNEVTLYHSLFQPTVFGVIPRLQATPFASLYETKAIVPIKIMVPSTRLVFASKLTDPHDRTHDLDALVERRKMQKTYEFAIKSKLTEPTESKASTPKC